MVFRANKDTKYNFLNTNAFLKFQDNLFLHFPTLDSTNLYALNIVSKSNPTEGTAISTYNQVNGRGQIGSKWESQPNKNISLSIILYPNFLKATQGFQLNQAISLAVWEFLAEQIPSNVHIKWPNDLYVHDKKIGGMLIQNAIQGQHLQSSVVGIGINVNQELFSKSLPNPTSLVNETKKTFDLDELTANLFDHVEHNYFLLKNGNLKQIQKQYLTVLYRLNVPTSFTQKDGESFVGIIRSTTESGQIEIENEQGDMLKFNLKEIVYNK